jgi:acyl-CoA thioesterase-1
MNQLRESSWAVIFGFSLAAISSLALKTHGQETPRDSGPRNPAFAPVTDDPKLPRVMLIGDSISIGYTVPVRELLAGAANVHRPLTNCGPTTRGLEQLDAWLGEEKWDVIHFNFGLHDLKHIDHAGRLASPRDGARQVPPAIYAENLKSIIKRLQQTGASLIWCTTTPVPVGAQGRLAGAAADYNRVAAAVVKETIGEEAIIDDLFAFATGRLDVIQRPANVHFTPDGSRQLAQQVAKSIRDQLPRDK